MSYILAAVGFSFAVVCGVGVLMALVGLVDFFCEWSSGAE